MRHKKNNSNLKVRHNGFSLIEVMIVGGLVLVIALGLSSLITNVNNQTQALNQKLESLELKARLEKIFATQPGYCGSPGFSVDGLEFSMTSPDVDTTTASDSEPMFTTPIYEGPTTTFAKFLEPGKKIGSVEIESLRLRNIRQLDAADPKRFLAEFTAEIKQGKFMGKIRPITYPIIVETYNGTDDPRTIKTCIGNNPGAGTLDLVNFHKTNWECTPKCPASHPFTCGVKICGSNEYSAEPATFGFSAWNCVEGCGNWPDGNVDTPKIQLMCCKML